MSIKQQCPPCMLGNHDQHNRDWGIRPGLIGGSWCPCTGNCKTPEQKVVASDLRR